jgi:multidrug resistance efflux pump
MLAAHEIPAAKKGWYRSILTHLAVQVAAVHVEQPAPQQAASTAPTFARNKRLLRCRLLSVVPDGDLAPPQSGCQRCDSLKRSMIAAWEEVEQLNDKLAQRDAALAAARHEAAATWDLRAELAASHQAEHELATVRGEVDALLTALDKQEELLGQQHGNVMQATKKLRRTKRVTDDKDVAVADDAERAARHSIFKNDGSASSPLFGMIGHYCTTMPTWARHANVGQRAHRPQKGGHLPMAVFVRATVVVHRHLLCALA